MSIQSDFLVRDIQQLAEATLRLMGLRPGDEALEGIETDVEQHLGVPISMFEQMTLPGLTSFVTMESGPGSRRTLLVGLAVAARCEQASDDDNHARVADLRPRALALIGAALDREPPLRSVAVAEVYGALLEDESDA